MEIRLADVILNESTVNTPFKCDCNGSVNTKPLNSNEPRSNETQNGVLGCTLTIAFSVPFGQGDVIKEIEALRQLNQDIEISSDKYFEGQIKLRNVRTVQITSFKTGLSAGPNDMATACTIVLLQKNSPDEEDLASTEENLSITPSDPASGFSIAEQIAHYSEGQKATPGLFLGDGIV